MGMYIKYMIKAVVRPKRSCMNRPGKYCKTRRLSRGERGAGGSDYQASIQCWAIIGAPAKHHLNGVSLVGQ